MDSNSIILVAAICVVIGFLIGGLVSSLGGKKETNLGREAALKIWRDPEKDQLVVEIDGEDFDNSIGLNATQRSQVGQIILELNQWLGSRPISEQTATDLPAEPTPPAPPKPRLSINPVNILTNALQADIPKSQLPTESIVAQIDDILQEKLRVSPLQGEAVRLMEWPGKGMIVMIGLEKYDSVEDIPNPVIQEMIHAAVKEWEQGGEGK